jgi:multisubunit Na+/H+ antiporter MnhG subunit
VLITSPLSTHAIAQAARRRPSAQDDEARMARRRHGS